jgi:hypothetical protein
MSDKRSGNSSETHKPRPQVEIAPLELPDLDEWVRRSGEEDSQL